MLLCRGVQQILKNAARIVGHYSPSWIDCYHDAMRIVCMEAFKLLKEIN